MPYNDLKALSHQNLPASEPGEQSGIDSFYLQKRPPIKLLGLLFFMILASVTVHAQVKDSTAINDVIIRIDGNIIYGKVLEVGQDQVTYRKSGLPDGPAITLPRRQVYAISYSNNTKQVITPIFGKRKVDELAFDENSLDNSSNDFSNENLSYNLSHGDLKVALGFGRDYSSFKDVRNYDKTASAPSLFMAYQFSFNRFLILGANAGYASFNYDYKYSSDYDQIDITQDIREIIGTLGFHGRFNLMESFVKPYLFLGVNINYSHATMNGDIFFRDTAKHILTTTGTRGFKTDVAARAGVDVMFSDQFGLYSDIGTGTSLLQIGAIFSFK